MFGISGTHLLILLVVLLVFGPKKIPELGYTLGKMMRKFRETFQGIHEPDFKKLGEKDADRT